MSSCSGPNGDAKGIFCAQEQKGSEWLGVEAITPSELHVFVFTALAAMKDGVDFPLARDAN